MIIIKRNERHPVWNCTIILSETPAAYYAIDGSALGAPHVKGEGNTPHAALDDALREIGLMTIGNPTDAGRSQ